jgi:hypothetical protein
VCAGRPPSYAKFMVADEYTGAEDPHRERLRRQQLPDDDHNDQSMVQPAITLVRLIYALPVRTGLAEKALVGRHNEYRCVNRT